MDLKKFRNKYDLELIPASHAKINLGLLVWDPIIGKPKFEHPGMPNHIFNAFYDCGLLSESEYKGLLKEIGKSDLVPAAFAETSLELDVDMLGSLDYPLVTTLKGSLELSKVKKFSFGKLKAAIMSNLMLVQIDDQLERMKKKQWKEYDGKVRRAYMITELYYGSINMVVDKEWEAELDLELKKHAIAPEAKASLSKSTQYEFSHKKVPFAMRLEKVRKFNG